MSSSFVLTRLEGGIGRVTLNRSDKRNALTRSFMEQILDAIASLAKDESLRVVQIQSTGSVFCAGMDLGEMEQRATSADPTSEWDRDSEVYCQMLETIYLLPIPTVATVQGPALAGGVGLMLACDIVVASDEAFFALPEPARGLTAAMVTPLLVHRVGFGAARYLLLSGTRCPAHTARDLGLCQEVVPSAKLSEATDQLIDSILSGSRTALQMTKTHLDQCDEGKVVEQLRASISVSAAARKTEDAREGLQAFLEKRRPSWQPDI